MNGVCYKYGVIDVSRIQINENELRQRLGCPPDRVELIPKCLQMLKKSAHFRYTCRFSEVNIGKDGVELGFGKIRSVDLTKNLLGCSRALLFGVTLGSEADRLLMKLSRTSPAEAFVTDAIASAMTESLCDAVEGLILKDTPHRPRFSPGYGDLPLEIQGPFLSFLDAQKTAGIALSAAQLMSPSKSITAITGIV